LDINQIGINYYYNSTKQPITSACIAPHKEHEKFSVVYSISVYSDGFDTNDGSQSYLSFNLKSAKSNGDVKVPLNDCSGLLMISYVHNNNIFCFLLILYIQIPVGL
jgi:hypothetical protein